jgi:hypothetical protein
MDVYFDFDIPAFSVSHYCPSQFLLSLSLSLSSPSTLNVVRCSDEQDLLPSTVTQS